MKLKRYKGRKFRRNITVFSLDTETKPINGNWVKRRTKKKEVTKGAIQVFYCGGFQKVFPELSPIFVYKDGRYLIRKLLENCGRKSFVFAHNMQFDFRVLIPFFPKEMVIKNIIPESDIFYAITEIGKRKIYWISTTNFVKASLRKIAEKFGFERKLELDYENIEKLDFNEVKRYLERDIEIVSELVQTILQIHEKYDVKLTISVSQLAFNIWRKHFIPKHVTIETSRSESIREIERNAYYGGRTEVFKTELKFGYYVDFSSLYPSVMVKNYFPVKFIDVIENPSLEEVQDFMTFHHVIGEFFVEDFEHIPLFPKRIGNKLYFPNGRFWTFLSNAEAKKGLELGKIRKCRMLILYERKSGLFDSFVNTFYKLKSEERNKAFRNFWKYILNSLSGKFGQRNVEYEKNNELPIDEQFYSGYFFDLEKNEELKVIIINGEKFLVKREKDAKFNFTPIIAEITSLARVRLYEALKLVEDDVCYCDTDSLFVSQKGFRILEVSKLIGNGLGKLKVEAVVRNMHFLSPKVYIGEFAKSEDSKFEFKRKIKGIPKRFIEEEYMRRFRGEKFTGFKETIRYFGIAIPIVLEIVKELKLETKRRKFGKITKPITLYES